MKFPSFILGYHGCDKSIADKVLEGKTEVKVSKNSYDWLGTGAYFWENNPARALSWAKFLSTLDLPKASKINKPAVIGAIIDPGNCLDLAEESSIKLVQSAHKGLTKLTKESGSPLPKNEPGFGGDKDYIKRNLDCAVLNFLHHISHESFDTLRSPFLEGSPIFKGSKFVEKCHVQWCIRNPKTSIIGYFKPRDPEATEL